MYLPTWKKIVIGISTATIGIGALGAIAYRFYVDKTGNNFVGKFIDDQKDKHIIVYEDDTGIKITEKQLNDLREKHIFVSNEDLIKSEKLKYDLSKEKPYVEPNTIEVVDETTKNEFEYWSVVKKLKTLFKNNADALAENGTINPNSTKQIRYIHNIYFSGFEIYIDANVIDIQDGLYTEKRILISSTVLEWEDHPDASVYEKLNMVDEMGFLEDSILPMDTITTQLSDSIFEQAKTKIPDLAEYGEQGYEISLYSTMQNKENVEHPSTIAYAVVLTKDTETRILYVNTDVVNPTSSPTFTNTRCFVSEPMMNNWAEIKEQFDAEQASASATSIEALNTNPSVFIEGDSARLTIYENGQKYVENFTLTN